MRQSQAYSSNLIIFLSLILLLLVSCGSFKGGGGNGPPPPPPTNADVFIGIKGILISRTLSCPERRFITRFEPVSLTGTEGRETELILDQNIDGGVFNIDSCLYNNIVTNLRAGNWRIQVQHPASIWTGQCTETLINGNNTINFTINRVSCLRVGFP